MKKLLLISLVAGLTTVASAQVNITAADMPVSGDTLRYSLAAGTGIDFTTTGASTTWNFNTLIATTQAVDTYKTAAQVNPIYALTISPTAYGYKVADSIPGLGTLLPISVKTLYTFYNKKTSPSRYIAEGFAASISSLPTAANYQDEDEIYLFPLVFGTTNDSTTFRLNFSLPGVGGMVQKGYRKTTVDGWGTITTPYYTTPINCIRVRSEIHEIDSVNITLAPVPIGIPRNTVEYKWLAPGEHYPALWITTTLTGTTETVSSVRYRDVNRPGVLTVQSTAKTVSSISVYPNPTNGNFIHISIPADWNNTTTELFDMQGRVVATYQNTATLNVETLSAGNYAIKVTSGNAKAYSTFCKN